MTVLENANSITTSRRKRKPRTPEQKAKQAEYAKQYRQTEAYRVSQAKYYTGKGKSTRAKYKHSESGLESQRKYHRTDSGKATQLRYVESEQCRTTHSAYHRSNPGKTAARRYAQTLAGVFNHSRGRAKHSGLPFEITLEDVEQLAEKQWMLCALSGVELELQLNHPNKLSIDRRDSNRGYTLDNIQLVAASVNIAKNTKSDEDFIKMCHAVATRNPL